MVRAAALLVVAGVLAGMASLAGCGRPVSEMQAYQPPTKDYARPLPPGQWALRKIDPSRYPDFGRGFPANRDALLAAVNNSLEYMRKSSSQRYFPSNGITHAREVQSLERFKALLMQAQSGAALNDAIRNDFDVYQSVGCDDAGTVYFTGYYTPIFPGRKQRDATYRYPLYSRPADLVSDPEGQILGQRRPDGSIAPRYPTRQEIEQGRLLEGHEVAWLRDPFEAYVITVQGSAHLRLEDGSLFELGYAGNNGWEYIPIARAMIEAGIIGRNEVSLQRLLAYFHDHPEQTYHYAWKNNRYVFFKEYPGGTVGSLNVPVTTLHSVATDKSIFPRAAVVFIDTALPSDYGNQTQSQPYAGFALDQDTGGAIRAAGKCDIYMGVGPQAEARAGRTGAEGQLYYIFVTE